MRKFEDTLEVIIRKTFQDELAFNRVKKGVIIISGVTLYRNSEIKNAGQIEISRVCASFFSGTENKSKQVWVKFSLEYYY